MDGWMDGERERERREPMTNCSRDEREPLKTDPFAPRERSEMRGSARSGPFIATRKRANLIGQFTLRPLVTLHPSIHPALVSISQQYF